MTQWLKIGQVALQFGADDFVRAIRALGKVPVQRDTLYRTVKVWN